MPNIKKNTELLIEAAKCGDAVEVKRLIPVSDPKTDGSHALQRAAREGHTQCVELLIPVSAPKSNNSAALQQAAYNGHIRCIELLIPVSDPKTNDSYALRRAVRNGHPQCVDLLYPVSDPMVALKNLQDEYPDDYSKWGLLQQMVEAEQLHTVLHKEIGETMGVKVQRKM